MYIAKRSKPYLNFNGNWFTINGTNLLEICELSYFQYRRAILPNLESQAPNVGIPSYPQRNGYISISA